jgi:hypothetical protein
MIGLALIFVIAGVSIAGIWSIIPMEYQIGLVENQAVFLIPPEFKIITLVVGIIIAIAGLILIWMRLSQTTAIHLVKRGRPGHINWLYVYEDGEMRFTPSIRSGEKLLYNADMDGNIINVKTYSLADHKICIVPECIGHGVDLDYVTYVTIGQSKWGWENLKEAREGAVWVLQKLGINKWKEKETISHVTVGRDIPKLQEKIREQRETVRADQRTAKLPRASRT